MKLLFILGTRPEAVKLAPVILEARARPRVTVQVLSTGQHRDMLRPILGMFGISPDTDLDLMRPNQSLESLVARSLTGIGEALERDWPDAVVVQGDTSTAMAGALAAYYRRIPVAHVEAGLRTDDIYSPFPEELNRRVISQVATWHLAPTRQAAENLARENLPVATLPNARVVITGNTVIDALKIATERLRQEPSQCEQCDLARRWKAQPGRYVILVTGHRRENFGGPFEELCHGLLDIARAHPEVLIIYPVHLNPNVQRPVQALLGTQHNIHLAPVLEYPDFVSLMTLSDLVITDSGGVQEEAPWLGIPVLVTRHTTERPEAVDAGGVLLVGPNRARLLNETNRLLTDGEAYRAMAVRRSVYGDGHAARRCVDVILGERVDEFAAEG